MVSTRNKLAISFFLILALGALSAFMRAPKVSSIEDIDPGKFYETISESPIVKEDFIVFFWYGCPHCLNSYSEMISSGFIEKVKSESMTIRKIPATFGSVWTLHARMFYALDAFGMSDDGHVLVMKSFQKRPSNTIDQVKRLISDMRDKYGNENRDFSYDDEEILKDMFSPRVNQLIETDGHIIAKSGLSGVPSVLVSGRHRVNLSLSVNYRDLPTVSYLLATEAKQ